MAIIDCIKNKKYPRFFIRTQGPFGGDTKFIRINFLDKTPISIAHNGTKVICYNLSERECESFVESGVWREIEIEEVALL